MYLSGLGHNLYKILMVIIYLTLENYPQQILKVTLHAKIIHIIEIPSRKLDDDIIS